jgi:hypothetical protein
MEVGDRLHDPEARPGGALGVVLVRERDPERGHDRVAGELLDRASVGLDAARDLVEESVDAAARDLRVDERGRLDEIGEQHGGELALP